MDGSDSGAAPEHAALPSTSPAPLRGMQLPVWVRSDKIESAAMLGAFLAYRATCSGEAETQLHHLYCIEHRSTPLLWCGMPLPVETVRPDNVPARECSDDMCPRCKNGAGGFKSKWWSLRWAEGYDFRRLRSDSGTSAQIMQRLTTLPA